MPDREKVIKALELCSVREAPCTDCPYDEYGFIPDCFSALAKDALKLLKEQEAVAPSTSHHLFICPVCKTTLKREQKFCHECGQEMKWE